MEVTYSRLFEKFKDKGYELEFIYLVIPPPHFNLYLYPNNMSITHRKEIFDRSVMKVYSEHWDEMNTWIDYQNYK